MFLELVGNELHLDASGHRLKLRHTTQLSLWGLKEHRGIYKGPLSSDELLLKLLAYLEHQQFQVTLSAECTKHIQKLEDQRSAFFQVSEYLKAYKDGKVDRKAFNEHCRKVGSLYRQLKEHQIKASFHLYAARHAANFSVPGSGKTAVVLSVYHRLKVEGNVDALFVVGPASCFGPWKEEFAAVFGKDPSVTTFAGGNVATRKEEYYKKQFSELNLSTFQTVARDYSEIPKLFATARMLLVIDEAHYIKQLDGEWAHAVLSIAPHARYRVVLSGTPMPKNYTDFFNLFDFLYPRENVITTQQKAALRNYENNHDVQSATDLLDKVVGPLFYRVRKSELGLAPQVFREPLKVKMNPYEEQIYDAILTRIINYSRNDYLQNIDFVRQLIRGRMIRLRQCISYTKLLSAAVDGYDEDIFGGEMTLKKLVIDYDQIEIPAKLGVLLELVDEFLSRGEKLVIWSNFIGTIRLIESKFHARGIICKKIIGEIPTENRGVEEEETREQIRREFVDKDSELRILIANPAACAESISLHASCNNAIYYDLSYNCAQYLQSLDRIHRVGGSEERPSYYHFLQYENTIDSDILDNLNRKGDRMQALIDKNYEIYSLDMFDDEDELEAYFRLTRNE